MGNPSLDNRLKAKNFHSPQILAKLQLKALIPNLMHLLIIGSGYEDDLKFDVYAQSYSWNSKTLLVSRYSPSFVSDFCSKPQVKANA